MKTKICSRCKKEKSIKEFYLDKRKKDGLYPYCKLCHRDICNNWANKHGGLKKWQREYNVKIKGTKISTARVYAKKRYIAKQYGIPFNINRDEFIQWYADVKQECTYCGLKVEDIEKYKKFLPNTNTFYLSIDRIDNSRGYSIDNICLACTRCNLIKSNFFSFEEMMEIGQKYVKPKWN